MSLLAVRRDPPARFRWLLWVLAFTLPLAVWSAISYVPWLWHPQVVVTSPGSVSWMQPGLRVERADFASEVATAKSAGLLPPTGLPANPLYLPAPHEVARALHGAFTTAPRLKGDKWLHESIVVSIKTIFYGFILSSIFAIPLGIACGSFPALSRMTEPFVDFVRYMPAPAFGALMVAIFGIHLEPKVAIVFLGTFFTQVLVTAGTVRRVDAALIEAAQTLGAKRSLLVRRVILPASLPEIYNDTRILIGCAWTYLVVAEVVGVSSGITFFINQQAKYRNFDNVYAAILIIGFIGLVTDQFLSFIGARLFGWKLTRRSRTRAFLGWIFSPRHQLYFPGKTSS
jgi:NitT/TauT family transport system permease protein